MAKPFPDSPFYRGAESPCRFEAEIYDCIVYGEIPKSIDGTFYRYPYCFNFADPSKE
jgi:hypothetical protein